MTYKDVCRLMFHDNLARLVSSEVKLWVDSKLVLTQDKQVRAGVYAAAACTQYSMSTVFTKIDELVGTGSWANASVYVEAAVRELIGEKSVTVKVTNSATVITKALPSDYDSIVRLADILRRMNPSSDQDWAYNRAKNLLMEANAIEEFKSR